VCNWVANFRFLMNFLLFILKTKFTNCGLD